MHCAVCCCDQMRLQPRPAIQGMQVAPKRFMQLACSGAWRREVGVPGCRAASAADCASAMVRHRYGQRYSCWWRWQTSTALQPGQHSGWHGNLLGTAGSQLTSPKHAFHCSQHAGTRCWLLLAVVQLLHRLWRRVQQRWCSRYSMLASGNLGTCKAVTAGLRAFTQRPQ